MRLARSVVVRRQPSRILLAATRLARGRSIGAELRRRAELQPIRPPGMTEFAAQWIFGGDQPEGIPIDDERLAELSEPPGGMEKPAFLRELDDRRRLQEVAEAERRSKPVLRGQVHEVPPAFRLSGRRPAPPPEPSPAAAPVRDRVVAARTDVEHPSAPRAALAPADDSPAPSADVAAVPAPPVEIVSALQAEEPASAHDLEHEPEPEPDPEPALVPQVLAAPTEAPGSRPGEPAARQPAAVRTPLLRPARVPRQSDPAVPARPLLAVRRAPSLEPVPAAAAESRRSGPSAPPAEAGRPGSLLRRVREALRVRQREDPLTPAEPAAPGRIRAPQELGRQVAAVAASTPPPTPVRLGEQPPVEGSPERPTPPTSSARVVPRAADRPVSLDLLAAERTEGEPELEAIELTGDLDLGPVPEAPLTVAPAPARDDDAQPGFGHPAGVEPDTRQRGLARRRPDRAESEAPLPGARRRFRPPPLRPLLRQPRLDRGRDEPGAPIAEVAEVSAPPRRSAPPARADAAVWTLTLGTGDHQPSGAPTSRPTLTVRRREAAAAGSVHRSTVRDARRLATATSGIRLAEWSGGALSVDGGGRETVSFPAPSPPVESSAAAMVFRATEQPEPAAPTSTPSAVAAQAMPSHPAAPPPAALPQVDELYEHVVERLRRDLLVERERMGDLLGDLP
jgi:hypothetical protein